MRFARVQKPSLLAIEYDTNVLPISYDFCWALAWADLRRAELGLQSIGVTIADLRKDFVHSRPPGHPDYVSTEDLRWRVAHLIAPLARLHGSVSYVSVCGPDEAHARHALFSRRCAAASIRLPAIPAMYREVNSARKPGRGFTTGGRARGVLAGLLGPLDNIVSISIRESTGGRVRNSRIDEWNAFAEAIRKDGFNPVFVPDTDRWADQPKFAGVSLPIAALDLDVRLALYETSKMNMFVNNGPAALCYLTPKTPCLIFKILAPGERLSSEEVLRDLGFTLGASPVFSTGYQKWVWEDDTFDVIYREFQKFRAHS